MKQFIDIIPHSNLFKQDLCLPHLKTKSLSMPNSKLINNSHRYSDRNSIDLAHFNTNNQMKKNQKSIFNLQQIQRKGKLDQTIKANIYQRKKILSQYQTVDLWKEKHSLVLHIEVKKNKKQKSKQKQRKKSSNNHIIFQGSINKFIEEEESVFRLKKLTKMNSHSKFHKSRQIIPYLPQEVVVQKIDQIKKIKKDQKLSTILKKQNKESPQNIRRMYKIPTPAAQITIKQKLKSTNKNDLQQELSDKNNPSKWQTQIHYFEDQQNF